MRYIRMVTLIFMVLLFYTGCASRADRAKQFNNRGVDFYQKGDYAKALEQFTHALEFEPANADAHYNMGLVYFEKRELDRAIDEYMKSVTCKGGGGPWAYLNLGSALAQKCSFDEAVGAYKEAIKVRPDFPEAYNNLAVALENLGKTDEAIAAYRKAVELKADYFEPLYNLGMLLQKKKEYSEAVKIYEKAHIVKPDEPYIYFNLACCYAPMGQKEKALAALSSAFEKGFEYPDIAEKYTPALASLKKERQFKEIIEKARARKVKKS
jgi:tetratricopeptide (TPR) repeat protein